MYEGLLAETITLTGHNGDLINAYLARPLGSGRAARDGRGCPRRACPWHEALPDRASWHPRAVQTRLSGHEPRVVVGSLRQ